jgi:hypothetical protein
MADVCRNSNTAVAAGMVILTNHSQMNSRPLAANSSRVNAAGAILVAQRAWAAASRSELIEAAMSIMGRA